MRRIPVYVLVASSWACGGPTAHAPAPPPAPRAATPPSAPAESEAQLAAWRNARQPLVMGQPVPFADLDCAGAVAASPPARAPDPTLHAALAGRRWCRGEAAGSEAYPSTMLVELTFDDNSVRQQSTVVQDDGQGAGGGPIGRSCWKLDGATLYLMAYGTTTWVAVGVSHVPGVPGLEQLVLDGQTYAGCREGPLLEPEIMKK